ncbi:MAG: helix-turn-helix domain containing protein [Nitrospira sp.]|nr:helix-turn-helix domain containing protein [Nitrospira sp.]MCW5800758.1 helix-turn-helix domain-containing protein [Nitrospira sp.]
MHIATRHHHLINSRLAMLRYADEYGFKGAARRFSLNRKTVRTWHRRWVVSGPAGLVPRHPRTRAASCTLPRCGPGSCWIGCIASA